MHSARLALLALAAFVLAPRPARAQLHVDVRVSPVADLIHQLDCVAAVIHACGTADYRALWRARLLQGPADSAALETWRSVRARYDASIEIETSASDAVGRELRRVSLSQRWRVAGLQARDWSDYDERLALVLLPGDRSQAVATLAHFRPRFMAWWDAEARDRLMRARDTLDRLLASGEPRALLDRVRGFYGATGPESDTLTLTLVARAGLAGRGTSAEVVDGWAVQELLPDASPAREVGVTLHEVAHLLLSLAPDSVRQSIAGTLARDGIRGRAVRSLLDEGLATAFGNGLVERAVRPADRWDAYRARPLSFYNDSIIDVAGKALMPALDSLLRAGASLGDAATLAALTRHLEGAMGPRLVRPRALLHDVWGFVDERVDGARQVASAIQRTLRPGNFSLSIDSAGGVPVEVLARDPWVGGIVVAPAGSLARIAARGAFRAQDVPAIRRAAARGAVLYGARRANGARTWVVVARTAAEAEPLLEGLASLDHDADGPVAVTAARTAAATGAPRR